MWRPSLDPVRLATDVAGWRVEVVESTPSTNAVVSERARADEPAGLVVTTEHQYAGRGRLDRGWQMPPRAGLALSVLVRPSASTTPAAWSWLPLLTGVAVAETVAALGIHSTVKWPNDVLVGELKICGILVERVQTPSGPAAVIGIGLNTSLAADELPVPSATSLSLQVGPVDRTQILLDLLDALGVQLRIWADDLELTQEIYRVHSATIGRRVEVQLPAGATLVGTATDVTADGRLIVHSVDGEEHTVAAGDVIHASLT
ncbi:MAG: biotin--[acetyl-CoA-carboxylase] ligase [Nocardioides sp.]